MTFTCLTLVLPSLWLRRTKGRSSRRSSSGDHGDCCVHRDAAVPAIMETAVDLMVQSVLRFVAVAEVCAGSRKRSFAGVASAPGTQHFAQQREPLCAGAVLYSAEPADRSCDRRTRSRRSATQTWIDSCRRSRPS